VGSGGFRVGAGAKPKSAEQSFLHGKRASRRAKGSRNDAKGSPNAASRPVVALDVPASLTDDQRAVWLDLAPHAQRAGTLTAQTAASFARLCAAVVRLRRWQQLIEKDGETYLKVTIDGAGQEQTEIKAHPLITRSQVLEKDIRSWSKDYAINPFGKPLVTDPAPPRDPFDEFDEPPDTLQ